MFAKSPPIICPMDCTASQIIDGDFAKFCGLLRIYELYHSVQIGESNPENVLIFER